MQPPGATAYLLTDRFNRMLPIAAASAVGSSLLGVYLSFFLNASTGAEHLRIAVGQRFYFSDQQVTLNETPRSASSSDLLVGAEGRLSDVWSVVGLMQYNLDSGNTERFNFGGRYTPAPGRVVFP